MVMLQTYCLIAMILTGAIMLIVAAVALSVQKYYQRRMEEAENLGEKISYRRAARSMLIVAVVAVVIALAAFTLALSYS